MSSEKSNFTLGGVVALTGCVVGFALTLAALGTVLNTATDHVEGLLGDAPVAAAEKSPAERFAEEAGLPFVETRGLPIEAFAVALVDIQPDLSNISMTEKETVYDIDGAAVTEVYLVDLLTRHDPWTFRNKDTIYSAECTVDGDDVQTRIVYRYPGERDHVSTSDLDRNRAISTLTQRYCQAALDTGIFETFKETAKAAS